MTRDWTFDEAANAGEEHLDPAAVARYDEKIPFNPSREIDRLLDLELTADDTVVDFGTGTGVFPLAIAEHCDRVVGVDVSEQMLAVAAEKVSARGIENVDLVRAGFLGYDHEGDPAGFVFSKNALHHLPDFWKVEALKRMGDTLEAGGILRLRDLVYSFDPAHSDEAIESWLRGMESTDFTQEELQRHVREEFSTYGFLVEAMLERTGFEILEASYRDGFYASYTCRWHGRPD